MRTSQAPFLETELQRSAFFHCIYGAVGAAIEEGVVQRQKSLEMSSTYQGFTPFQCTYTQSMVEPLNVMGSSNGRRPPGVVSKTTQVQGVLVLVLVDRSHTSVRAAHAAAIRP